MKITNPLLDRLGGLGVAFVTRGWMSTLEYRGLYYDPRLDPAAADFQGPFIFVSWHEYIPIQFYLRSRCNITLLLSQHRDANWLAQAARYVGFETVRGSTTRGGVAALREMMRNRQTNFAMTPDGPRGPRRRLAPGPIFLASRLGLPIVCVGLGYDRPWRLPTWDRFAVPKPFSQVRTVLGPAIPVPREAGRGELEHYRQHVEGVLNRLTLEAEQWAESGKRHADQVVVRRQPRPLTRRAA